MIPRLRRAALCGLLTTLGGIRAVLAAPVVDLLAARAEPAVLIPSIPLTPSVDDRVAFGAGTDLLPWGNTVTARCDAALRSAAMITAQTVAPLVRQIRAVRVAMAPALRSGKIVVNGSELRALYFRLMSVEAGLRSRAAAHLGSEEAAKLWLHAEETPPGALEDATATYMRHATLVGGTVERDAASDAALIWTAVHRTGAYAPDPRSEHIVALITGLSVPVGNAAMLRRTYWSTLQLQLMVQGRRGGRNVLLRARTSKRMPGEGLAQSAEPWADQFTITPPQAHLGMDEMRIHWRQDLWGRPPAVQVEETLPYEERVIRARYADHTNWHPSGSP
ncbi:MAG: hypothetical protein HY552_06405 [Elusimicrobia bacterium]|nr:hypothetical protein [Elusimicrobiota bacterium]